MSAARSGGSELSAPVTEDLSSFSEIFAGNAPFVSAYLDATRTTEHGAHEVALRWQALRESVADRGGDSVPDAALDAVDGVIRADRAPGRHGLVVIADRNAVLLSEVLAHPPAQDCIDVGALPHLMPLIAARAGALPHVVVIADRTGADVIAPTGSESVQGSAQYPVHLTTTADWSEWHFQRRVQHSWEVNAGEVAVAAREAAAVSNASLIVLAGDPVARGLLRSALADDHHFDVDEVTAGGRGEGASSGALRDAVRDVVWRHVWARRRGVLEHLQANTGRQRYVAIGVPDVVAALQRAQADVVVLSDDPSSPLTAWVGAQPTQLALDREEVIAMGVGEPAQVRLDAALVRAVAGTGARLVVTPNAHRYVRDGLAALLRFETAS